MEEEGGGGRCVVRRTGGGEAKEGSRESGLLGSTVGTSSFSPSHKEQSD